MRAHRPAKQIDDGAYIHRPIVSFAKQIATSLYAQPACNTEQRKAGLAFATLTYSLKEFLFCREGKSIIEIAIDEADKKGRTRIRVSIDHYSECRRRNFFFDSDGLVIRPDHESEDIIYSGKHEDAEEQLVEWLAEMSVINPRIHYGLQRYCIAAGQGRALP